MAAAWSNCSPNCVINPIIPAWCSSAWRQCSGIAIARLAVPENFYERVRHGLASDSNLICRKPREITATSVRDQRKPQRFSIFVHTQRNVNNYVIDSIVFPQKSFIGWFLFSRIRRWYFSVTRVFTVARNRPVISPWRAVVVEQRSKGHGGTGAGGM